MIRACSGAASGNSEIDMNLFRRIAYTPYEVRPVSSNQLLCREGDIHHLSELLVN